MALKSAYHALATGFDRLVKALHHVVLLEMIPDGVCVTIELGYFVSEIGGVFPGDGSEGGNIAYGDSPVTHKKRGIHGEFQRADLKLAVPGIDDSIAPDWQGHDVSQPVLLPSVGHHGLALCQSGSLGQDVSPDDYSVSGEGLDMVSTITKRVAPPGWAGFSGETATP